MRRSYLAFLTLLLCISLPALTYAKCGHATLTGTASTLVAANDVTDAFGNALQGRHGLCVYNTASGTTTPTMSFTINNNAAPTWQNNHVYAQGQIILDSAGNTQLVTTAGTSGTGAHPTWATSSGSTTTDGTVTWTLMQVGVAAIAADFLLMPSGANNGVENFECFYAVGNALVPGGAVSAISSGGATVAYCSW